MKKSAFVVVRTDSAGVHVGTLVSAKGRDVVLAKARRVWRWRGANTLHELALRGAAEDWTRISEPVAEVALTGAIEILTTTKEAAANLSRSRWSGYGSGRDASGTPANEVDHIVRVRGRVDGDGSGYGDGAGVSAGRRPDPKPIASPTREEIGSAFNEWMRRYTEEPERFSREWQTIRDFLAEQAVGSVPTYGNECEAYLAELVSEARGGPDRHEERR